MQSGQTTNGNLPVGGPTTPREQVLHLLYAPLPELNPPGLAPDQLAGLRSLPESDRLKLVYAVNAPEPIADQVPAATLRAAS